MMWNYDVSEAARDDIAAIERYELSFRDAEEVDELIDSFVEAFRKLCENPFLRQEYVFEPSIPLGRKYRSFNVKCYKVFYWVEEEAGLIHIFRILHVKSDFTRRSF